MSTNDRPSSRLRRVGALWRPKPGAKSKGSGSVTVNGLRQRFVVLPNDRKTEGSRDPDYVLMSSEEPEVDEYARERQQPPVGGPAFEPPDDPWATAPDEAFPRSAARR
jgi:hypothetical protein